MSLEIPWRTVSTFLFLPSFLFLSSSSPCLAPPSCSLCLLCFLSPCVCLFVCLLSSHSIFNFLSFIFSLFPFYLYLSFLSFYFLPSFHIFLFAFPSKLFFSLRSCFSQLLSLFHLSLFHFLFRPSPFLSPLPLSTSFPLFNPFPFLSHFFPLLTSISFPPLFLFSLFSTFTSSNFALLSVLFSPFPLLSSLFQSSSFLLALSLYFLSMQISTLVHTHKHMHIYVCRHIDT